MGLPHRERRRSGLANSSVFCPVCGHPGTLGHGCGRCLAPDAIVRGLLEHGGRPRFVAILGPSGVGKTVYQGMLLDMLSRGAGGLSGVPRGPFSLSLQRNLMLALEHQRFPEKTPSEPDRWHWLHCEVSTGRRGSTFDLIGIDVAGESIMHELEQPGSNITIRALIAHCAGMVILIDMPRVILDDSSQEIFAMQLVSALDSVHAGRKRKCRIPVAFVFTKADLCEEAVDDPAAFASSNTLALYRLCQTRLQHARFFCAGVAGSSASLVDDRGVPMIIPLRVEPRNIVEPFAWILTQIR